MSAGMLRYLCMLMLVEGLNRHAGVTYSHVLASA